LALRINNFDVYKINYNQIANVIHSTIDPPLASDNTYYFYEYEGYYSFLPVNVSTASLDYISTPPNVVWGYTYDKDDRQIYNSGTSSQPLWDNNSCREITKRMLTNIGVSFKDNDFQNFGAKTQAAG
jgi:hypothetical protein